MSYNELELNKKNEITSQINKINTDISSVMENISDAFVTYDSQWRYIYVNKATEELLGHSKEELLGQCVWDFFPETKDTLFYSEFHRSMLEQTPVTVEQYYEPFEKWLLVRCYPAKDTFSIYFQDITAKKVVENLNKAKEDYFRELADNTPSMLWVNDKDGQCVYLNKYWCDFTGTSLEDNLKLGWLKYIHPDDVEETEKLFFDATEKLLPFNIEYRLKRYDGEYIWVMDSGLPRCSKDGEYLGYAGSVVDIHTRKMSEQSVKSNEQKLEQEVKNRTLQLESEKAKLKSLFMAAPAIICIFEGPEHRYELVNPLYSQINGNRQLLGKNIREAQPELQGQGIYELLDSVYKTGTPFLGNEIPLKIVNQGITEEKYFNFVYQPSFDIDQKVDGIMVFAFDITEQVISRKEVEKLNEELIHSQIEYKLLNESLESQIEQRTAELLIINRDMERSNESLRSFAHVASHDLQEPLRTITGYAKLLANRYKDKFDDSANEFFDYMIAGTDRMKVLIEDILAYSQVNPENIKEESVNLNEVMKVVNENLKASISENNVLIKYDNLPTITANYTYINQLFQNLISNAIKYRKKDIDPVINISTEKKDNKWLFVIKDNGIGIDKNNIDKLFIVFKRLHGKSEYDGTGIGLATCKKIVELYNGKIWIESELDKGSTFYFTLPV